MNKRTTRSNPNTGPTFQYAKAKSPKKFTNISSASKPSTRGRTTSGLNTSITSSRGQSKTPQRINPVNSGSPSTSEQALRGSSIDFSPDSSDQEGDTLGEDNNPANFQSVSAHIFVSASDLLQDQTIKEEPSCQEEFHPQ